MKQSDPVVPSRGRRAKPETDDAGVRNTRKVDVLFDGAEILRQHRAAWGGLHARLLTMRRGVVARNELQTSHHALFMGVHGDAHRATVTMDGIPPWTGVKGPGSSAFCAAERHVVGLHGKGQGTTLVLFFDQTAVAGVLQHSRALNWRSRPSADDPFIAASGAELAQVLAGPADDLAALWAQTLATNLVIHSARRFSDLTAPPAERGGAIDRALGLVHDMLPAAASLDQLSRASGLPPARLLSGFKARTGFTPHQYIIRERLNRARHLLADTGLSVASVSRVVGCSNAEHLGRMFRQHVGLSPQAWRRTHGRS